MENSAFIMKLNDVPKPHRSKNRQSAPLKSYIQRYDVWTTLYCYRFFFSNLCQPTHQHGSVPS